MGRPVKLGVAVLAMTLIAGAALAPAHTIRTSTTLSMLLTPYDDPYSAVAKAGVKGEATAAANPYCEQGRKVELFRDGKKIASADTDRYGVWYTPSIDPLLPGRYVAKTKQRALPASTQHKPGKAHRRLCKAAQSKPVVITPEIVASVTS